jgi:solute carrier family 6 (neurotransmitter transporter)
MTQLTAKPYLKPIKNIHNFTLRILKCASEAYVVSTCVSERKSTYIFLQPNSVRPLPSLGRTPIRYMTHTMLIAGSRITVPGMDPRHQSGYQVLRLATELVPSTLALLGADAVSPFWAILFYFVLILFGIAQQVCSAVTCTSRTGR